MAEQLGSKALSKVYHLILKTLGKDNNLSITFEIQSGVWKSLVQTLFISFDFMKFMKGVT